MVRVKYNEEVEKHRFVQGTVNITFHDLKKKEKKTYYNGDLKTSIGKEKILKTVRKRNLQSCIPSLEPITHRFFQTQCQIPPMHTYRT